MNVQEAESKVCYDNTTIERPKEIAFGGKGKYCSIPCCKNTQYDGDWKKTNIALFKFPDKERKPDLYKAWFNKIKTFRRKGGKDAFTVTNNTYVCEFHFEISDIQVSAGRHIKTLKNNVIPSVFIFKKKSTPVKKRSSPRKRRLIQDLVPRKHQKVTDDEDNFHVPPIVHDHNQQSSSTCCENCNKFSSENILLKEKIKALEEEKQKLEEDLKSKELVVNSLKNRLFMYSNFVSDEKRFRTTTGLEVEKFNILYEYLDPGQDCENIKYHEPATDKDAWRQ